MIKLKSKITDQTYFAIQWTGGKENKIEVKQFGLDSRGENIKVLCNGQCLVRLQGRMMPITKMSYILLSINPDSGERFFKVMTPETIRKDFVRTE